MVHSLGAVLEGLGWNLALGAGPFAPPQAPRVRGVIQGLRFSALLGLAAAASAGDQPWAFGPRDR